MKKVEVLRFLEMANCVCNFKEIIYCQCHEKSIKNTVIFIGAYYK